MAHVTLEEMESISRSGKLQEWSKTQGITRCPTCLEPFTDAFEVAAVMQLRNDRIVGFCRPCIEDILVTVLGATGREIVRGALLVSAGGRAQ